MAFAEKLAELRRQRGWSQEQLANRLGITRQSVSKWESGTAMPDLEKLIALSELLDVTIDFLVKDSALPDSGRPVAAGSLEARLDDLRRCVDPVIFSYTSRTTLFGLPLVSVRFSKERGPTKSSTAIGIVAIGNFSVGVVSIGLISAGLLFLGMIALGALALGGVAIGIVAIGASAVGIYAAGASALGKEIAVGTAAHAETALGTEAGGTNVLLRSQFSTAAEAEAFLRQHHPGLWPPLLRLLARFAC